MRFYALVLTPLAACAAFSIPVRQTYQAVDEVPVGDKGGVVALDTGETFDVSQILTQEGKRPTQLLVHKVEGTFVLVGEGFRNLYVINPKGDSAGVDFIPLSGAPNGVQQPKLRPGVASKCTVLTYNAAQGNERKLFIGADGKTSPTDCPDKKESSGS